MWDFAVPFVVSAALALAGAGAANAQFGRGGGEWMTSGGDAQRSSWNSRG
jgi:hypothetical protein